MATQTPCTRASRTRARHLGALAEVFSVLLAHLEKLSLALLPPLHCFGTPQGGLPPLRPVHNMYPPGFSRPVGHSPSPTNTPPGNTAPSGRGAGPQSSGPPNTPPADSPAGSSTPAGKDASPEKAGARAAPQSEPQTDPDPDEKSASPHVPDLLIRPGEV